MANAMDQAEASRTLRNSLAIAAGTLPSTPVMLRLMTANGTASSNGTSVAGGSYAPQNLTTALGTEANGSVTNSTAITFTGLPAATIVGCEVWDSAGSPRRLWWGALSASKTVGAGDSLSVAISSLVISNNN